MFILMFVRLKSCCIFARLKKEYYFSLEIMKRTFQPSRRKKETSTVSANAWLQLTDEKFWLLEELKEERNYLFHQNRVTKNDCVYIYFRGVTFFGSSTFFLSS